MVRSRKSFLQKRTAMWGGRSLATVWYTCFWESLSKARLYSLEKWRLGKRAAWSSSPVEGRQVDVVLS